MDLERNPIIADTGFVVALLNRLDTRHSEVTTIYTQQEQILLPQTVLYDKIKILIVLSRERESVRVKASQLPQPKRLRLIPLLINLFYCDS